MSEQTAPEPAEQTAPAPRWQPITALDRRVLGVLGEKAKTTPDAYPMTLNAIKTGANQKNNRYPLMEVEIEDLEEALARLRGLGAVAEIQGGSRVAKYRHFLYDWLGVGKVEMAVMVELLLRGAQTEGELRGRAARMEPIADLAALRPVLASLKAKGLILSLTPEGRGHALSHALYEPREIEKVRREFEHSRPLEASPDEAATVPAGKATAAMSSLRPAANAPQAASAGAGRATIPDPEGASLAVLVSVVETLRSEIAVLKSEVARTRKDLDDLWAELR